MTAAIELEDDAAASVGNVLPVRSTPSSTSSEMSVVRQPTIATLARAQTQWVGIPVFSTTPPSSMTVRVMVRTDRGIEKPADLNGKLSASLESPADRGHLDALGAAERIRRRCRQLQHWHMERQSRSESRRSGRADSRHPASTSQYVPKDVNFGQMLIDGELDALAGQDRCEEPRRMQPLRSTRARVPNVRYLFDPAAESKCLATKSTKILPLINHCLVVRRSIVEKYPWSCC